MHFFLGTGFWHAFSEGNFRVSFEENFPAFFEWGFPAFFVGNSRAFLKENCSTFFGKYHRVFLVRTPPAPLKVSSPPSSVTMHSLNKSCDVSPFSPPFCLYYGNETCASRIHPPSYLQTPARVLVVPGYHFQLLQHLVPFLFSSSLHVNNPAQADCHWQQ